MLEELKQNLYSRYTTFKGKKYLVLETFYKEPSEPTMKAYQAFSVFDPTNNYQSESTHCLWIELDDDKISKPVC